MDGMLRRHSLERTLFLWLAAATVLPALVVLVVTLVAGSRALSLMGTLGPWNRVAESGRVLIDAADRAAQDRAGLPDSALQAAAADHRADLSESLLQAGRWEFLGRRLAAAAPLVAGAVALVLVAMALLLSRLLARDLTRPIAELVAWAGRLGRGEALPPAEPGEMREAEEVRVLRGALRQAATEIEEGRRRGLEAERTRAWGELARRVAHEMKNPLTPLRLAAHRLERATERDPVVREAAEVIRDETERLDALARGFAMLGRPATVGPAAEVDLGELLGELLQSDVPEAIERRLEIAPGTSRVLGHYDALQRAFRNVIRNAVEAISEANSGVRGASDVRVQPVDAGHIEVVVADNGAGIPAGLAEAIFEPDRTLKAKGTGLGLAIVRQVTAAHGGTVVARNRVTRGAEFVIRLPGGTRRAAAPTAGG
jgi:nitrogen fixation/metabolism regulation signal transduction histidine kinase